MIEAPPPRIPTESIAGRRPIASSVVSVIGGVLELSFAFVVYSVYGPCLGVPSLVCVGVWTVVLAAIAAGSVSVVGGIVIYLRPRFAIVSGASILGVSIDVGVKALLSFGTLPGPAFLPTAALISAFFLPAILGGLLAVIWKLTDRS